MKDFPTKKDFWYCAIISTIITIFLLSHFTGNRSVLGAKLEFTSTITSIILSVIAIIYTLIESSNNKSTSDKIINASDVISNVTEKIDTSSSELIKVIKKLEDLNLDSTLLDFKSGIDTINESLISVEDKMNTGMTEIKNKLSNPAPSSQNNIVDSKDKDTAINYFIKQVLDSAKNRNNFNKFYHIDEIIYVYYKMNALKLEYEKMTYYVLKCIDDNRSEELIKGINYGILGMAHLFGVIFWSKQKNMFTNFHEDLMPIVKWVEDNKKDYVIKVNSIMEENKQDCSDDGAE